jgi:hypothetical protein
MRHLGNHGYVYLLRQIRAGAYTVSVKTGFSKIAEMRGKGSGLQFAILLLSGFGQFQRPARELQIAGLTPSSNR